MENNKIFMLVLLICMVGLTSANYDVVQDVGEKTQAALPQGWYWPPLPWWRIPPWWWQPPPPPPPPPHRHHNPPPHHPKHPPKHPKPPRSPPPSRHNPPHSPPPSRHNPPPPPPVHRNPPPPTHHNPPPPPPRRRNPPPPPPRHRPPPPPPPPPSAPADDRSRPQPKIVDPADCPKALINVDGCVSELIRSFFGKKVSVGGACCGTILGMSDDCFTKAFTQFKAPDFINKVRGFCAPQQ